MAGAGYKLFNTGDVLLASEVNTYLQQQVTMVFADAAARTTALSGVLAEGMMSYLQDTNTVAVYNGSSWVNVGNAGDITEVQAGTGISVASGTGPIPVVTSTVATTFDAKGDLVVGTGADTFSKLTAGSNGDTLVADSAATTGLRWSSTPSANNPQINGAFDIWQRGTSVSVAAGSNSTYTADRFIYNVGANQAATVSRQATGDTTNLPFIQYCARVQRNSGQTGTGTTYFICSWESVNSIPFAGKTVTMSFYARKGANYSATSDALVYKLVSGTGTDQNESISGFTGAANVINQTATLTSTWQRFSASATVATTATQLATEFLYTPTGTAGANDYYEITGIQLDVGSVALPFRRNGGTIQGELAACQRYFQLITGGGDANGSFFSANKAILSVSFPVTMRVAPTATYNTTYTNAVDEIGVALRTPTGYATAYSSTQGLSFEPSGMTAATAQNGAVYIGGSHQLSAEL